MILSGEPPIVIVSYTDVLGGYYLGTAWPREVVARAGHPLRLIEYKGSLDSKNFVLPGNCTKQI